MAAKFSVCNFFIIWCSYHENVHILQIVMTCLLLFVWYSGKEFHWTHCGRKSSFTPHGVFVLRINPTSKQFPPFWQLPGLHNHCNYMSSPLPEKKNVTSLMLLFFLRQKTWVRNWGEYLLGKSKMDEVADLRVGKATNFLLFGVFFLIIMIPVVKLRFFLSYAAYAIEFSRLRITVTACVCGTV